MSECKYFFNDAQVTLEEYKELMAGSKVDVPAKFHMTKPIELLTEKAVKEVTKMPKKVVTNVSSGKSKIEQASSFDLNATSPTRDKFNNKLDKPN